MERGYRRFVRGYPNSKIRVAKTRYPYGTKFRGALTHFMALVSFYTSCKHQERLVF